MQLLFDVLNIYYIKYKIVCKCVDWQFIHMYRFKAIVMQ